MTVRAARVAVPLGLMLLLLPGMAQAEYALATGDVVEVRVAGLPDLSQRAQVQLDGTVSLSGLGEVRVAGLTLADMRSKIVSALASKVFRQRTSDGQQRVVAVQPGEVTVAIAEYRPVYVNGDVLNPGQHAFRPALTVRQVIALSGGYSILQSRMLGSGDPLELQGQYASLAGQLAREQVRAARLQAELDGKSEIGPVAPGNSAVPSATMTELLHAEGESLNIAQAAHEREKAFLVSAIGRAGEQITTLKAEQVQEEQGLQSDRQDLERATRSFGSGSLPSPRVAESRRAMLASSTRRLQTTQSLIQIETLRDELVLKLQKLASDRRVGLLAALSQARVQLVELNARLANIRERIELLANAQGPARSKLEATAEIGIVRRTGQGWSSVPAVVDSELQPGDVVTIRLRGPADPLGSQAEAAY